MSLVVSIGRNTREGVLSDADWLGFRTEVLESVVSYSNTVHFVGDGLGSSEEWDSEEAMTVVAEESELWHPLLDELSDIRFKYGQEAVAVQSKYTEGQVVLV